MILLAALCDPWAARAETQTVSCYLASDDQDGDGYARKGAAARSVEVASTASKLQCPAGYVVKADDCDDTRATTHPSTWEISVNDLDDDCDGLVDESTFTYYSTGNANTQSSFQMQVKVRAQAVRAVTKDLYAEIELVKLKDSAHPLKLGKVAVTDVDPAGGDYYATLGVSGLSQFTLYRARVQFYLGTRSASKPGLPGLMTYAAVGPVSDWYYTTTDGTGETSLARTRILLRGFHQYDESQRGDVGYLGDEDLDGTRYGASEGELWCSEFYSWAAGDEASGLAGKSSTGGLIDAFTKEGLFLAGSAIPTSATRADYLPVDTDGDGAINHSAMFLAYDASVSPAKVWTLEGNSGNKVKISTRELNERLTGLGHLASAILD